MAPHWKHVIRQELVHIFSSDRSSPTTSYKTLVSVLAFLDSLDKKEGSSAAAQVQWKLLWQCYSSGSWRQLKAAALDMISPSKSDNHDIVFLNAIRTIHEGIGEVEETADVLCQILVSTANEDGDDVDSGLENQVLTMSRNNQVATVTALKAVAKISKRGDKLLNIADLIVSAINGVVPVADVPLAIAKLVMLGLGVKCWANLKGWWVGTISGRKCAKYIAKEFVCVGSAVAGVAVGAAVGYAALGPVGGVGGGVVGGFVCRKLGKRLAELLANLFFENSKQQALDNAYRFLGVSSKASNSEINSAYRQKARMYHPDKSGGNSDMFCQLQMALAVIKLARGNGTCAEAESVLRAICQ